MNLNGAIFEVSEKTSKRKNETPSQPKETFICQVVMQSIRKEFQR